MKQLLTLNLPPSLEDRMLDYLLELDCAGGFSSYPVRGHGDHSSLSIAEQVTGRRNRMQVEIFMEETDIPILLNGLRTEVGKDIVYWAIPITELGHI